MQEGVTLWFKLGDWVMEHAVTFLCTLVQVQTVLCYSYAYDIIFITYFQNRTYICILVSG